VIDVAASHQSALHSCGHAAQHATKPAGTATVR